MAHAKPDYLALLPYCETRVQERYLRLLDKNRTVKQAAEEAGVSERACLAALARIRKLAAKQGWSPEHDMTRTVPEGFQVKGVSTYYDEDGKPRGQWVKSAIDREQQERLAREALDAMCEQIKPARIVKPKKLARDANLANLYICTDYHLGMKAWAEQTKDDDWDISIAEDLLVKYFQYSIMHSPQAEQAVFAQLGDFLHWDGVLGAVTPLSGHNLDADTRYEKLVRVAIRVLRKVQHMLLQKYERVHIIHAEGNHDLTGSVWLREMFSALYENEPRITVETSPDPYYCFEWGLTSLFFHHGHKKKLRDLDHVMAAKFREVFGRTKYSYCHAGHLHHEKSYESNLMVTEQHRTLAAPDAYASSHGYLSGRTAPAITYHKEYGEVSRLSVSPEMFREEE